MSDDIQALLARKKAALMAALSSPDTTSQTSESKATPSTADIPTSSAPDAESTDKSLSKAEKRRQRAKENKKLMRDLHSTWKESEKTRKEEVLVGVVQCKEEEKTAMKDEVPADETMEDFESSLLYGNMEGKDDSNGPKLTKKERRQLNLVKVAHLKQIAPRPELVEPQDVTAQDPHFLVYLKAYPNSVPVPVHWSQKRKFLDNKKGYQKPPYVLPKFIEDTGIAQMRPTAAEEEQKSLRKEMRERARPKLGRLEIDYSVLHDAFFVHQTKPPLSLHGEVYYECKEVEDPLKALRPGRPLSQALLSALGLAEATPSTPPPWLSAMQTFGPPPGYPHIRIPGVNAPLPPGASWGVGIGEWGRPPTDAMGKGRWGEIFGAPSVVGPCGVLVDHPMHARRGQLWAQVSRGEVEEAEEELAIVPAAEPVQAEEAQPGVVDHVVSLAHYANTEEAAAALAASGGVGAGGVVVGGERQLYTVLGQKEAAVGAAQFGTSFVYEVPSEAVSEGVAVSIAADELATMDTASLKRKYEAVTGDDKEKAELLEMLKEEEKKKKRRTEGQKLDIF